MSKLGDILTDLEQRQTQFHLAESIDRKQLDRYPVLKMLWEQRQAGLRISPEAERQLRQLKLR